MASLHFPQLGQCSQFWLKPGAFSEKKLDGPEPDWWRPSQLLTSSQHRWPLWVIWAPEPVRPALPGSLRGGGWRCRAGERGLRALGGGARQVSAASQEGRRRGGGTVFRCGTLKVGLLKGWDWCSSQRGGGRPPIGCYSPSLGCLEAVAAQPPSLVPHQHERLKGR